MATGAPSCTRATCPSARCSRIKYHQALRFYADEKVKYEMPDFYRNAFGIDYVTGAACAARL